MRRTVSLYEVFKVSICEGTRGNECALKVLNARIAGRAADAQEALCVDHPVLRNVREARPQCVRTRPRAPRAPAGRAAGAACAVCTRRHRGQRCTSGRSETLMHSSRSTQPDGNAVQRHAVRLWHGLGLGRCKQALRYCRCRRGRSPSMTSGARSTGVSSAAVWVPLSAGVVMGAMDVLSDGLWILIAQVLPALLR
jgi:hypothetical protein